jgi:hypothetical protein
MGAALALSFFACWSIANAYTLPKLTILVLGILTMSFKKDLYVSKSAFLLWAAYALLCALSIDPVYSFLGHYGERELCFWGATIVLLFTCGDDLRWVRYAGVLLGAYCLSQRLWRDPLSLFMSMETIPGRAAGLMGSPIDAGCVLAMALCLDWPERPIFFYPSSAMILGGLWATGSRAAWLAAACGLLVKKGMKKSAVILCGMALLYATEPKLPKDKARVEIWKTAVISWIEHPWLGSGPDTFLLQFRKHRGPEFSKAMGKTTALQRHAHNDWLEALSSCGLAGLLLWLAFTLPLYSVPALMALLVNMKFNPIGLPVLCLGAMLVKDDKRINARPIALGLCLLSLLLLTLIWYSEMVTPVIPEVSYFKRLYDAGVIIPKMADQLVRIHPKDPETQFTKAVSDGRTGNLQGYRNHKSVARVLDSEFEFYK